MYLALLDDEKKELFLNLEIHISRTDGEFGDDEKMIIDTHCMEMGIDNHNYESWINYDSVISTLSEQCNKLEKRIIFFELAAVVLADGVYHDNEKTMLYELGKYFDINNDKVDGLIDTLIGLRRIYAECVAFVEGD